MSIKHWMAATLAIASAAWSLPQNGQTDPLRKLEDSELGVTLSGQSRSQLLRAGLSGDSVRLGQPTHENAAFTQADISLIGRPSADTRGTVIFRVHQDWNNYYDEGPNPISTRWFNYEGTTLDDKLSFSVGDFRTKRSPLLLHAAEPELLLEPEIFANRRRVAMGEWFLGDNRLPLQGLDGAYAFSPLSALDLEVGLTGARLRSSGSGSTGWLFHTGNVEKYAGSGQIKATVLDAVEVGVTHLEIIDRVAASRARNNAYHLLKSLSLYENVTVNQGSLGLDVGSLVGLKAFSLKLGAEMALSGYESKRDSAFHDSVGFHVVIDSVPDPANPGQYVKTQRNAADYSDGLTLKDLENLDGKALAANIRMGFAPEGGAFGLALDVGYLRNDKNYVNDLAQTPTFGMSRILNSKSGVGGYRGGYSTLDALYNHVYSVDPITSVNTSELWGQGSAYRYNGTNNWYRAAQTKNAYTYSTATKIERDGMGVPGDADSPLDPHVQLLFPYGPATPNRDGVNASLTATALERKIEAKVIFASLKEPEGEAMDSLTAAPADYARLGGGLSLRVNEFIGLANRIEVAGSWQEDSRKRPAFSSKGISVAAVDFKTAMVNAGFYAGIYKGLAILGGFQQIKSNPVVGAAQAANARTFTEGDLTQSQWAAGLELKLTHGAYVTAEYGILDVKETKNGAVFSQDVSSVSLLLAF